MHMALCFNLILVAIGMENPTVGDSGFAGCVSRKPTVTVSVVIRPFGT